MYFNDLNILLMQIMMIIILLYKCNHRSKSWERRVGCGNPDNPPQLGGLSSIYRGINLWRKFFEFFILANTANVFGNGTHPFAFMTSGVFSGKTGDKILKIRTKICAFSAIWMLVGPKS